jgi:hypothetical protein
LKKAEKDLPLGAVVRHVMEGHPAFAADPLGDWQDVVGADAARNSQPVSLRKGVLVIVTEDSVWRHHLELHKTALMDFINSKRSEPIIHKIVIRIGGLPESAPVLNPEHRKLEKIRPQKLKPQKPRKEKPRTLTPEEKAFLKTIPDPELRAVGARLLKYTRLDEA